MDIKQLNEGLDNPINEELSPEIITSIIGGATGITIGLMAQFVIFKALGIYKHGPEGVGGRLAKNINSFLGIQGAKKIVKLMKNKNEAELKDMAKEMKGLSPRVSQFAKVLEAHYKGEKTREQVIKAFERMSHKDQKSFGKGDK